MQPRGFEAEKTVRSESVTEETECNSSQVADLGSIQGMKWKCIPHHAWFLSFSQTHYGLPAVQSWVSTHVQWALRFCLFYMHHHMSMKAASLQGLYLTTTTKKPFAHIYIMGLSWRTMLSKHPFHIPLSFASFDGLHWNEGETPPLARSSHYLTSCCLPNQDLTAQSLYSH